MSAAREPGSYMGILPSGATVQGTKAAILEMHAAIWRAEPTTDCAGQTYRDFAERCDRARQEAVQRAVDAKKLAEELVTGVSSLRAPQSGPDATILSVTPPQYLGGCNCVGKAPTIPTCRGPNTHLNDCPAKDSGFPVGATAAPRKPKPCFSCETGHMVPIEVPVCDTCGDFLVGGDGRLARLLDRVLSSRVAGSGAETPPQPPPIYVYNGPPEGFKVLHFPELPNDRAVVLGPSDKLELRWVTPPQPEPNQR